MSGKRVGIRFIHSHEQETPWVTSTETRRRLHSHAARATHAKTRQQRMTQHQATADGQEEGHIPEKPAVEIQVAVLPTPTGTLGSGRRDPFASFARRLSPMEDFLLDYYMHNVVPCSKIETTQTTRRLNEEFVQLVATTATALNGLFLVTCRHLSLSLPQRGSHFTQLALQYKVVCARRLMEAISSLEMRSSICDSVITIAVFLAQDEILVGDIASTQRHLQGAIQMVRHNGALNKKGFNEFLYGIIQNDIAESAMMQESTPLPQLVGKLQT
ncbi:hypothetical protein CPLU01_07857 [Colletotrichum plurivorum]|uniref:Uncharacterized protein n=1 Tax=Colletotrichum plurivorum TaxID=2175906 RepID=A0A8H6KF44_9PEZI|nr:hypothetical protein CPLU01_07857 [Colletotrichum plurivorum]